MIRKIVTKLVVVCSIIFISYSVSAQSLTISGIFKDAKFASVIASKLGKAVDDNVSQDELDTITGASVIVGAAKLESLEGISHLTNLKGIIIDGSKISELPEEITKLENLSELQINGSELASIPSNINKLTNLQRISFKNNVITTLPNSFEDLTALKTVDLSGNQLTEVNSKFANITSLNLTSNSLSAISDSITNIASLEALDLRNNQLTSLNLKIDDMANLSELYVTNNKISSKVPEVILKAGKLDKYSMENHTQYATLDDLFIYNDQQVTSDILLPDLLKQIKEDSNGTLAGFGSWTITRPDNTSQTIAGATGSEITSDMFSDTGKYTVTFNSTNKQIRYWGYSSFSRSLTVIDATKPTISVDTNISMYEDESTTLENLTYDSSHELKFKIADSSIISYEDNQIKGLKAGKTTIQLWVNDGYSNSDVVDVTVTIKANPNISSKNSITEIKLSKDQKVNLADYVNTTDGSIISATSADDSIAVIETANAKATNNIYLKAVSAGKTTISLSASDGTKTSTPIEFNVVVSDSTTTAPSDDNDNIQNGIIPSAGSTVLIITLFASALAGSTYLLYRRKLNI